MARATNSSKCSGVILSLPMKRPLSRLFREKRPTKSLTCCAARLSQLQISKRSASSTTSSSSAGFHRISFRPWVPTTDRMTRRATAQLSKQTSFSAPRRAITSAVHAKIPPAVDDGRVNRSAASAEQRAEATDSNASSTAFVWLNEATISGRKMRHVCKGVYASLCTGALKKTGLHARTAIKE